MRRRALQRIGTLENSGGIQVGGKTLNLEEQDFQSVLKYALIPSEQWKTKAFRSGSMGQILALADDLSVEIVMAMAKDNVVHAFVDAQDLADNIALRKGVIAAMQAICSGEVDADYVEAVDGVPPTLGYLETLEALFTRGAKSGKSILTKELPFTAPDTAWEHMDGSDTWAGFAFKQNPDVALSTALQAITPFRGECAGALQLAIMVGCLNSLGADKLDALMACFGPAFVGAPFLPVAGEKQRVPTLATRFISQAVEIPKDYTRGTVIAVPGDYLYFKNKDDYPDLAPSGGWQGENCIYMGQDHLGNPHYSGLGLAWKTEFAFRMFLTNAYLNDTNTDYLKALETRVKPKTDLHILSDPQKQVRFVKRALMRFPAKGTGTAPNFQLPQGDIYPLGDEQVRAGFEKLGFRKISADLYEMDKILLQALMDTLRIGDRDFAQPASAPFGGGPLCAQLGGWRLVVDTIDTKIQHPDADDLVRAIAARSP